MLSYPKVNAQHKIGQETILSGPVVLEEKTDGSQIRIKITPDSIEFGSRRAEFNERGIDSNFNIGIKKFLENNSQQEFSNWFRNVNFIAENKLIAVHYFGEYFSKPKQNTIPYNRIPKNHIMLFDMALEYEDGIIEWKDDFWLSNHANWLYIEAVPVLGRGEFTLEQIKQLSEEESVLGGAKREGVVIKARDRRYNTTLLSLEDHPFMCAKYVRPEFQEENHAEHPRRSDKLKELNESYCTKARWQKAIFRLRDEGVLDGTMKDLKYLIPEVQNDIKTEDKDEIKEKLWQLFNKDLIRHSVKGLPEYYQEVIITGGNE